MSANPEAFDFLRKHAYLYVRKHGRDFAGLYAHLQTLLSQWKRDNAHLDLAPSDEVALPRDIARWCVECYEAPKRQRSGRTDADRAEFGDFVYDVHDSHLRRGEKLPFWKLAKKTDTSKSTAHRLVTNRTRREARRKAVESLGQRAKQVFALVEMNFHPSDERLVFAMDEVGEALAFPVQSRKPSAVSMRRKRTEAAFREIAAHAALGYSFERQGLQVQIWRTGVTDDVREHDREATVTDKAQTRKARRIYVDYKDIPPELFWRTFGASNEALDIAALVNIGNGSTNPRDYSKMMRVAIRRWPNMEIYHAICQALRKEIRLHQYLKGAKRFLVLPSEEMNDIDTLCEFLSHLPMLSVEGPVGGELLFLLNKFGYVDAIDARGVDARRRFDFAIHLLNLPKGVDAFSDFLWLERTGSWRFRPELSNEDNVPGNYSREYPWRQPLMKDVLQN